MTVVVAVGSFKGGPGASTVALGLAGGWPAAVLVEADPHGGDVGDRFGFAAPPGLGSAVAAARHGTGPGWLAEHVQRLPVGVEVLLGGRTAEAATAAVASLARYPDCLVEHGGPVVVVDVGRMCPGSVALPLVAAAEVVLVVTRPELADLRHVATGLARLPLPARQRTRLVLAGRGTYGPREIAAELGVSVAGVVPRDRWGAAVLAGRVAPVRGWRQLRGPRMLAQLAAGLAAQLATGSGEAGEVDAVASGVDVDGSGRDEVEVAVS